MQSTEGSNPQIRACYVAARIYCPMSMAERDAEFCLRCAHFAGVLTEAGRLAMACSFEPKERDSVPVFQFAARAA